MPSARTSWTCCCAAGCPARVLVGSFTIMRAVARFCLDVIGADARAVRQDPIRMPCRCAMSQAVNLVEKMRAGHDRNHGSKPAAPRLKKCRLSCNFWSKTMRMSIPLAAAIGKRVASFSRGS